MLRAKPIIELFDGAQAAVVHRIRRDRGRVSEELRGVFDHIEERFYDVDINVDDMLRKGVLDDRLRQRFRKEMGLPIKRYLLRLKEELARWLLWKTRLKIRHVAELLGYSQPYNFTRDFHSWTGKYPEAFRDVRRGLTNVRAPSLLRERMAAIRERICSRLGIELPPMGEMSLAAVAPEALFAYRGEPTICPPPGEPHAAEVAELIWQIVREESPGRRLRLLRHEVLFGGAELFELLSRQSREVGRCDRRRGLELAKLALATVEGSAALLGERYGDLHALALARLGNARRLAGDPEGADDAFERIEVMWSEPKGKLDHRVEAEIFYLKGTLRLFERRFDEALDLLDRSLVIARELGDVELQANALLQRIAVNGYQDRPEAMLPDLAEVQELLETQANPDRFILLGLLQERTLANLEKGRTDEAKKVLSQAKALCEELRHTPSRHQLQGIEARLAQAEGDETSAELLFRQAFAGFAEIGDREAVALVALELAILCHQQGRFGEVVELVVNAVIPGLEELRLAGEVEDALKLLREAVAAEAVSLAALHRAREVVRQIRRDSDGPFQGLV
ncbi:MAG: helix-turn-helix domain-containing protein [bacterium]|nr:helix-turn-helix domain-containing protein [bacterium]